MATRSLTAIDLVKNELRNAVIQVLATAPSSPVNGQVYYDSTLGQFGCYQAGVWVYLAAAGTTGITRAAAAAAANTMIVSAAADRTAKDYAGGAGLVKSTAAGVVSAAVANTDYAPVASPTFTGTVTIPATVNATDAAQKSYVDNVAQGLSPKPSVRVATTGSETFTVASGSVTQISGTTVDGVSPAVNDRILVKDAPAATGAGSANSTQPGNGVYFVSSNTTNLSLTRATDMDDANDPPAGAFVFVEAGTVNLNAGFVVGTPSSGAAFTYGTGNIAWIQFSGAGEITAGSGLAKTANTLSISAPVSIANGGTNATSVTAARTSLGAPGLFNSAAIGDGAATTLTVTHNLNNAIPLVQVYDVTATPVVVICDISATTANAVTLTFTTAPATGTIKCVVMG